MQSDQPVAQAEKITFDTGQELQSEIGGSKLLSRALAVAKEVTDPPDNEVIDEVVRLQVEFFSLNKIDEPLAQMVEAEKGLGPWEDLKEQAYHQAYLARLENSLMYWRRSNSENPRQRSMAMVVLKKRGLR